MAYTDLTSSFAYKTLLTYQLMNDVAANDKLFNDQLTGGIDIPNDLHLKNAQYLRGDVAATGTWYKLAGLDASNIVQIGDSATEVRVPADPVNALGIATKQYVDATNMLQAQPQVNVTLGSSGTLATILNYTGKGELHTIWAQADSTNAGTIRVKVTVDGVVVVDNTSDSIANLKYQGLTANLYWAPGAVTWTGVPSQIALTAYLLKIPFRTSIKVEATLSAANSNGTMTVFYSKVA